MAHHEWNRRTEILYQCRRVSRLTRDKNSKNLKYRELRCISVIVVLLSTCCNVHLFRITHHSQQIIMQQI